mmetsp:Transcript_3988/g.6678  ORF Transcript_3988/g.6678 Transcript_3988/m.6678 type:complete len:114 (+) Transcript_3988:57-398(+)
MTPQALLLLLPLLVLEVTTTALALTNTIPSTPCTRICRYNADFYDGQVCIGCYRDTFEISQWSSMSNVERSYALLDAADRIGDDGSLSSYEGAVSKEELLKQAKCWGEELMKE